MANKHILGLVFSIFAISACGGSSGSDSDSSTLPANQSPTANAGPDQSVDEGSTVTLAGSGADTDGSVSSFEWNQISGLAVTISEPNSMTASFAAPFVDDSEVLQFELTVTDNDGATGRDTMSVTVNDVATPPPNQAPAVDAGDDQSVQEGTQVDLSGTAADPDGAIESYRWSQISGTAVSIVDANTADASFTAPLVDATEVLQFQLTATDDDGATATDTVSITIEDVPPAGDTIPPVIVLQGDNPQLVAVGDPYVELGATATDDVDGDLSDAIVIDASAVNSSVPGEYPVTYDVSDAAGNAAQTVIRTVTVLGSGRLTDLQLSAGSLDQIFQPDIKTYTASVSVLVSSTTLTAIPEEESATITVNGVEMAAGEISYEVAVFLGSNTIELTVNSSDGTTSETYVIDLERLSTTAFSQKLTPGDAEEEDQFSRHLAIDGSTALISSTGDDVLGLNSGSVYVFTRSAGIWSEQQKLVASDGALNQRFGSDVAIEDDMALIVGGGAIYMFARAAGVWAEQQKFGPGDGALGGAIALDGNTAVFSAAGDTGRAVYVFEYLDGQWIERQKITPSDGAIGFGSAVALDGDTLVIGNNSEDIVCYHSGSAYVFHRINGVWTEHTKLIPSDARGESRFGNSVAVEETTIVVGAYLDTHYPQPDPSDCGIDFITAEGSAYVFLRNGDAWEEDQKLVASDEFEDDEFGSGVAIQRDTIVVSANDTMGGASFTVGYVFVHDGAEWVEMHKMTPVDARAIEWVQNPRIALDDGYVMIGAPWDFSTGNLSGAAMVFGGP